MRNATIQPDAFICNDIELDFEDSKLLGIDVYYAEGIISINTDYNTPVIPMFCENIYSLCEIKKFEENFNDYYTNNKI